MAWSTQWKQARDQGKQRKFRVNAPLHVRQRFFNAPLTTDLQEKVRKKRVGIKRGDRVEVLRGDYSGMGGTVEAIDRQAVRVYVDGITRNKVDGSEVRVPFHPSQVRITRLNTDDDRRFGFTIEQEDEEPEYTEKTGAADDNEADDTVAADVTEAKSTEESHVDTEKSDAETETLAAEVRKSIQEGTVADAKQCIDGLDYEGLREALALEKANKNRKGVISFIEEQMGNGGEQ